MPSTDPAATPEPATMSPTARATCRITVAGRVPAGGRRALRATTLPTRSTMT